MSIKTQNRVSRLMIMLGAVLAAGYILSGCAAGGVAAMPRGSDLASDHPTARELDEGRKSFVMECAVCHKRYFPGDRSPDDWKEILSRHTGRVPLANDGFDKLAEYVVRASERAQKQQ